MEGLWAHMAAGVAEVRDDYRYSPRDSSYPATLTV